MKKAWCLLFISLLLFISIQAVIGKPSREEREEPINNTATITGILRLVGNEPFTRFSLRTNEGENYILEDVLPEDWTEALGTRITVTGTLETRTLKSADETKTFTEHILLNAERVK